MISREILFVLSITTTLISCNCHVIAVKCCPLGSEMQANVLDCTPTTTSNTQLTTQEIETEASPSDSQDNVTSAVEEREEDEGEVEAEVDAEADIAEQGWRVAPNATVQFGWPSPCNMGQMLRLNAPGARNRFRWLRNGTLELRSPKTLGGHEKHLFEPGDFCADTYTDAAGTPQRTVLLCPCNQLRCVKKCCPFGQAFKCDVTGCNCYEDDAQWNPFHPAVEPPRKNFSYEVLIGFDMMCDEGYEISVDAFSGYPNYMVQKFWNKFWEESNICGDTMYVPYLSHRQAVVRCMPAYQFPTLGYLAHWLHVPEAVLLALAAVTILAVPRERLSVYSRVHDWAMVWHAGALFGRSVLWPPFAAEDWVAKCEQFPIAIYFFSLASAFCLNVICVNMARGFGKPLGARKIRSNTSTVPLLCYFAYAWGASAAMTGLTAYAWYAKEVPSWMLRPTLHETRTCFRELEGEGKIATFAYYYGPTAGLLIVNAVLFLSTVIRIRQLSSHSTVLVNKHSTSTDKSFASDSRVMIYVKLLCLMGVVETTVEIVTWSFNTNVFYNALATACIDVLRAVAIFGLCCCKRRTLLALRDRFWEWFPQRPWCICITFGDQSGAEKHIAKAEKKTSPKSTAASSSTDITLCSSSETLSDIK